MGAIRSSIHHKALALPWAGVLLLVGSYQDRYHESIKNRTLSLEPFSKLESPKALHPKLEKDFQAQIPQTSDPSLSSEAPCRSRLLPGRRVAKSGAIATTDGSRDKAARGCRMFYSSCHSHVYRAKH